MSSFFKKYIIFLLCSILAACVRPDDYKNFEGTDLTPALALPIVNSKLKVSDAIKKTGTKGYVLQINPDGYYTAFYRDTLYSKPADSVFNIKAINQQYFIGLSASEIAPQGFNVPIPVNRNISKTANQTFPIEMGEGSNLSRIRFKKGKLTIQVKSTLKHRVSTTLTLTNLKLNGTALQTSVTTDPQISNGQEQTILLSVAGYELDMATLRNQIQSQIAIALVSSGQSISSTDAIEVNYAFSEMLFSEAFGAFKPITYLNQEVFGNIDFFDNAIFGDILFTNPKIRQTYDNSLGVPLALRIDTVRAIADYGKIVSLDAPTVLGKTQALDYPSTSEVGNTKRSYLIGEGKAIDKQNSNIINFLNPAPNEIAVKVKAIAGDSTKDGFLQDRSRMSIYTEIELPLEAQVRFYDMKDSIKSLSLPEKEYIDSVAFNFYANNSIPLEVYLQGYFIDDKNQVLDSIQPQYPSNLIVSSAKIDNQGNVTAPTIENKRVVISSIRYDRIAGAKTFIIRGSMLSSSRATVPIRLTPSQVLDLKISLEVFGRVKTY
jgi:hypothetical protein